MGNIKWTTTDEEKFLVDHIPLYEAAQAEPLPKGKLQKHPVTNFLDKFFLQWYLKFEDYSNGKNMTSKEDNKKVSVQPLSTDDACSTSSPTAHQTLVQQPYRCSKVDQDKAHPSCKDTHRREGAAGPVRSNSVERRLESTKTKAPAKASVRPDACRHRDEG